MGLKKTILFLIPTLGNGGAERVLVNLVNHLNRERYDITIQTLFDEGIHKENLAPFIRYKSFMKHQFHGNARLIALLPPRLLYRIIVKEHYDIVVSFLEGPTARIISGCVYPESKKVYWIHTTSLSPRMFKLGFLTVCGARKAYTKANRIIGVSQEVERTFQTYLQADKAIFEICYNVNDSDSIIDRSSQPVDLSFPNDSLIVCSAGKLQKVKGFDRLIRVHKRLIDKGIKHCVIVLGEGEQRSSLEKLINEYDVGETFKLAGFCENPYKYMANCDLYVCSSYREGLSTAVTEALILGLPVVSTCCAGANELLGQNNEYGIICENSEDGLYNGMKQLLTDNEILKYYQEKATERGKQFNAAEITRDIERMFERL